MTEYLKPATDQEREYMRKLYETCYATQDAANLFFSMHNGPYWVHSLAHNDWLLLDRVSQEVADLYLRMYGHRWSEYYTDRNPYRKVS